MSRKFIEIAANLTDSMFQGIYHGSVKHQPDLDQLLLRSWSAGVDKIIITGTSLSESRSALDLCAKDSRLFCTVGCHPTNTGEFNRDSDPDSYLNDLDQLIKSNSENVVAIGEMGLDYDRLHFSDKSTQLKYFEKQLQLSQKYRLPLFLHCRAAFDDFFDLIVKYPPSSGVVHSFDGTFEEARQFVDLGLFVGVNGCSLKTEDNLNVVRQIPSERLLLETDAPWCEVRPTHAGFKYVKTKYESVKKEKWSPDRQIKGRNEPANIVHILEIVASIKNTDELELSRTLYENASKLFFGGS